MGRANIRPMSAKRCHGVLLAILVYVTLDLSLPAMPGAFVFEPADSAESTQIRARAACETVALSAQTRDPSCGLFQPLLEVKQRLALARSAERCGRPVVSCRSRTSYDLAPSSEDPH